MKTIGILTSGGDAPGMNAAIRAVVRLCIYHGIKVMGIKEGYNGLIEGDISELNLSSVGDIIHTGGTVLRSSRSEKFKTEEGVNKAVTVLDIFKIEGLVVIGGDGTFRGAKELHKRGISVVGIPATIDNDLGYTDYSIGFDTVVNTVVGLIGNIRDTSESHGGVNIVEVMGRDCGDIALYSGLAGGAEAIVLPEKEMDGDNICKKIIQGRTRGKRHSIIIMAEGSGDPYELREKIEGSISVRARVTILGYVQRGGSPTATDRIRAIDMGARAVELLIQGTSGQVVGIDKGEVINMDIDDALSVAKVFDEKSYELAEMISI